MIVRAQNVGGRAARDCVKVSVEGRAPLLALIVDGKFRRRDLMSDGQGRQLKHEDVTVSGRS